MDNPEINILSLCTGGAGLELGLQLALPGSDLDFALGSALPGARVVCAVERESYCAAVLLARMEETALEPCPVWCGDMAEFDGKPWRGVVDLISAGVPCQPWSVAGKRAGRADERDLWPDALRIIGEAEPECVFLENVPGILVRHGLDRMAGDLREMDYEVGAGLFSASEVGARLVRRRLFILALAGRARFQGPGQAPRADQRQGPPATLPRFGPPGPDDVSTIPRATDGVARELGWADSLRMLGNGVVPLQAAYAFVSLWAALSEAGQ